jgi:hypothetical protein
MASCSAPASRSLATTASQAADDDVEECNDAVDNGHADAADAVDDGHEDIPDGLADATKLMIVRWGILMGTWKRLRRRRLHPC